MHTGSVPLCDFLNFWFGVSQSTGNISDEFVNEIRPSGWTFTIWTVIYIFLALVMVYALSNIFRKYATFHIYVAALFNFLKNIFKL